MKNILLFSLLLFLLVGCTELGEPSMHPSDWTDQQSVDSHMAKIAVTGTEGCKDCHGGVEKNDYHGGTSGVSCYQCHFGGPSGHPAFDIWMGTHGDSEINRCKLCHGESLTGGITEVSCYTCHETF